MLSAASVHGCYSHRGAAGFPGEPRDTCATPATHPKWQGDQGRKSSGHKTPMQRKELKYRFSHLNHFTKGIQGTMYLDVEFWHMPKSSLELGVSSQSAKIFNWCHALKILIQTSGLFLVLLFCAVSAQQWTSPSQAPSPDSAGRAAEGDKAAVARGWVPGPSLPPSIQHSARVTLGAEEFSWHEAGSRECLAGLFCTSFSKWSLWWWDLHALSLHVWAALSCYCIVGGLSLIKRNVKTHLLRHM